MTVRRRADRLVASALTPPGGGGIAVVRVAGPGAAARVASHLDARLPDRTAMRGRPGALRLCWFVARGERIDRVIVRLADRRQGLQAGVELCCHGGVTAARRILSSLAADGIAAGAVRDGLRLPRLQAEAWEALIGARSVLAARVFAAELTRGMHHCLSQATSPPAAEIIREWLGRAASGRALWRPPRVAIVGPANAGKSTLFNALIGRERALVSDVPGTTRDPLRAALTIDGYVVDLWDTPGTCPVGDALGAAAQAEAEAAAARADLLVHVDDAAASAPAGAVEGIARRRSVWAASKADRSDHTCPPGWIPVSSRTGSGLDRLARRVRDRLGLVAADRLVGPVPFRRRHVEYLQLLLQEDRPPARRRLVADLLG